jgi:hypothetical protein
VYSNSLYPRFSSPVLRAWIIVIAWWPLGDILRKWGGLNQPVYVLQLLTPVLLLLYLLRKRAWVARRMIAVPALVLAFITGVTALYYSFTEYSFEYLGVWLLSLSSLLGPPLLFCTHSSAFKGDYKVLQKTMRNSIAFVASILFLNNLLSIIQSVLGRSHFLSVGAGGSFDAQISTNTAIELRAPGFFTFVTGNALFSVICVVFLLASLGSRAGFRANLIRILAFLVLPIALARSISRGFLFLLLALVLPFSSLLARRKTIITLFIFSVTFFVFLFISSGSQDLLRDGLLNFEKRIVDAGGVADGIVVRFFNSLFLDAGGGEETLFTNLGPWFRSDPLAMLFGYGLGFSGPLFRFVQGAQETAYGYVQFDGRQFLIGEAFYSSLLAEIGIINLVVYFWLAINTMRVFLDTFPLQPLTSSRAYVHAVFLALLLAFVTPYFRPAAVLSFSSWALMPHVCQLLFSQRKGVCFTFVRSDRSVLSPRLNSWLE